jgi:hypothetical protein
VVFINTVRTAYFVTNTVTTGIVRVCSADAMFEMLASSIANRALHAIQFEHAFSFVTKAYEVFL